MIVLCPSHNGDSGLARQVEKTARLCARERRHQVIPVFSQPDGIVKDFDFCVRPKAGPMTCNHLISGMIWRLPLNSLFLWLEPDSVLMRESALDELEDGFNAELKKKPELCLFGHDKRDQFQRLKHIAGPAVYRITPRLRDVFGVISHKRPHDVEISKYLIDTEFSAHTDLIRCVWHFEIEPYLAHYNKDVELLRRSHPEAAMIHGIRDASLLNLVWGDHEIFKETESRAA